MCAYGREVPWRGPAGLGSKVSYSPVVLVLGDGGLGRRGGAVAVGGAADVLQAEQDHGDVVAAAGRVGGGDELAAGVLEVVGGALEHGPHADLVDHRRQAVGAEQVDVPAAGGERLDVDLHVALGAERARDHRALRVRLRLLLGELAAGDELADERVVAREPRQLAAAPQVGARVADVGDRDVRLADVGGGAGRAHAGRLLVAARAVVDAPVGLLDDPHEALGGRAVAEARRRRTRRPSRRRPRRPGRRPCRPRPRTAASARSSCPRCPGAGGRDRTRGTVRKCAASAFKREGGVPDPDLVPRVQGLRAAQRLLVQVRAVRRSEILQHHDVPLRRESCVLR